MVNNLTTTLGSNWKSPAGTILFPAEGEGRNAVFAAGLGWTVSAFDKSVEGQKKALRLSETNKVTIDYQVGELQSLNFYEHQFDAMALIYAHFSMHIFVLQILDLQLDISSLPLL